MTGVPDSAKWLSCRIDLDFEKVSLDNVLKYIAEVLSATIIVDPDVAAAGIDLSTRVVDFKGKAVAVGDVLELILGPDLAFVPRAGHLFITTFDKLYLNLECKTYAVGVTCQGQELLIIVQRVVNHLADRQVAPWADEGGTAAIEYGNGVLIVTQTYGGHQRIADLLEKLNAEGFFSRGEHAEETSGVFVDAAKSADIRPDDTRSSAGASQSQAPQAAEQSAEGDAQDAAVRKSIAQWIWSFIKAVYGFTVEKVAKGTTDSITKRP